MPLLEIQELDHTYSPGTPFAARALEGINLTIEAGEFIGLVGHTGSGKSTLVQHLNGLLKPTSGRILVDGVDYQADQAGLPLLRQKVGLVFQYPEYQLFEETVKKDIAFGPSNLGLKGQELEDRVLDSMKRVGLDPETIGDKSPFELSGGQKRRVAIAGILAMKPGILVLDEPTAGLDPHGSQDILGEIKRIFEEEETTIILVSHSMDEVARLATRVIVMDQGRVVMDGPPRQVFKNRKELEDLGLGVPEARALMDDLVDRGLDLDPDCLDIDEAREALFRYLGVEDA